SCKTGRVAPTAIRDPGASGRSGPVEIDVLDVIAPGVGEEVPGELGGDELQVLVLERRGADLGGGGQGVMDGEDAVLVGRVNRPGFLGAIGHGPLAVVGRVRPLDDADAGAAVA